MRCTTTDRQHPAPHWFRLQRSAIHVGLLAAAPNLDHVTRTSSKDQLRQLLLCKRTRNVFANYSVWYIMNALIFRHWHTHSCYNTLWANRKHFTCKTRYLWAPPYFRKRMMRMRTKCLLLHPSETPKSNIKNRRSMNVFNFINYYVQIHPKLG